MTTSYSSTSSAFNWNSVALAGKFYWPRLRKITIALACLSLASMLVDIINVKPGFPLFGLFSSLSFIGGIIGAATLFLMYWCSSALVATDRTVEILLPVKASEKAAFLILYFYVLMPLIVFVPDFIGNAVGALISGDIQLLPRIHGLKIAMLGNEIDLLDIDFLVPISTALFVVVRSCRATLSKVILWSILPLLAGGLVIGIIFGALTFNFIKSNPSAAPDADKIMVFVTQHFNISLLEITSFIIIVAYVAVMAFLTVKAIKNIEP